MPESSVDINDDYHENAMGRVRVDREQEFLTSSLSSTGSYRTHINSSRYGHSARCFITLLGIVILIFLLFSPAGVWAPIPSPTEIELKCLANGKLLGAHLDLSSSLGKKMEPSGAVWRKSTQTLLVVSDNGRVEEYTKDGNRVNHWTIKPKRDMEGVTWIPDEPDVIYIAEEFPPTILKFNTTTGTIVKEFPLKLPLDQKDPNKGVEAITYLPYSSQRSLEALANEANLSPSSDGYFLVGIQETGDIYVFANPPQEKPFTKFRVPKMANAQRADLSDMTIFDHHIYFVFDKSKILARARLTDRADEWLHWEYFDLPDRGTEAIAFEGSDEKGVNLFIGLDYSETAALYQYHC